MSFCYSIDGGEIYERADSTTLEGVLAEAGEAVLLDGCGVPGGPFAIWVAIPRTAAQIMRSGYGQEAVGEAVAQQMVEWLSDDIPSDEPLFELPTDQHAELGELVIAYLERVGALNAWGVIGETAHTITVPILQSGGA
ncbi:MAG: hypothetical protein RLZZ373_3262 [Pseudomonadota bacterium]